MADLEAWQEIVSLILAAAAAGSAGGYDGALIVPGESGKAQARG